MKKGMFLVLAVIAFAGVSFASHGESYYAGYAEGYEHGLADKQAARDFDYRHSRTYQLGGSNRYIGVELRSFREGYSNGYRVGYHGGAYYRSPFASPYRNSNPSRSYNPYGFYNPYGSQDLRYERRGGVTAFTDEGFRGKARSFGIGSYPYLHGGWDDEIESIALNANVRVILFDKRNFRGERIVIERNAFDLGFFKRKAASMVIEPIR